MKKHKVADEVKCNYVEAGRKRLEFKGRGETLTRYDVSWRCTDCGAKTSNKRLYKDDVCEAKNRRKSARQGRRKQDRDNADKAYSY